MIKLPKEVKEIIKRCKEEEIEVYAIGECVREDLMGLHPLDWDLAAKATLEQLMTLFPEGNLMGGALRLTKAEESDINSMEDVPPEELIMDIVSYKEDVNEVLSRAKFTINAIAANPEMGVVDHYGGREDIKARLIRTVGEPKDLFKSKPISLLEAITIAANYDFDIHRATYEAMVESASLLEQVSVAQIREEFCNIIVAPYGGKGLRMLAGADLMPSIIGEAAGKMTRRQMEQFSELCDNLSKTKQNLTRRLGLFYTTLEGKKGEKAMKRLEFDGDTEQHIMDGLYLMEKIHFFRSVVDLKDALVAYGPERYEYMDNLAKAQRIVYNTSDSKIAMRRALMEDIMSRKDPVYVEDLAVDTKTLLKEGIAEERVDEILLMLTDMVHRKPTENTEKDLVKYAKKFARSKFAAKTRRVKWLR